MPVTAASGGPQSLSAFGYVDVPSSVPTLFGDGVVASVRESPSDAPSLSGKKLGRNFIRSCDGF